MEAEVIGGMVAALVGSTGVGGYLGARLRARADERKAAAREREADATVERSKVIAAERVEVATLTIEADRERRTEDRLWERLEAVEADTRKCHEQREADREAAAERERGAEARRLADKAACEAKVRHLEAALETALEDLGTVAGRSAETRRALNALRRPASVPPEPPRWDDDDTGLHELEEVAREHATPPGVILPVAPKRAMRRASVSAPEEDPR